MLWLWALVVAVVIYLFWRQQEGLSPNAYELSQMSVGDLASIDSQIEEAIKMKKDVEEIKSCVWNNQSNMVEIQKRIGQTDSNRLPNAYPLPPQKT